MLALTSAGAPPNNEKYTVHVTATSNGQPANVPDWNISVTDSKGKPVGPPGAPTFSVTKVVGQQGGNSFYIIASANTPLGDYVVTVTAAGGQKVTMKITVTDVPE